MEMTKDLLSFERRILSGNCSLKTRYCEYTENEQYTKDACAN